MPVDLFANVASTTLAGTITSGATSLTVASSSSFPTPTPGTSQFRVLIDTEYLLVTAITGTTWTVTRGAEGSTAASHTSGAPVSHVVTAGALGSLTPSATSDASKANVDFSNVTAATGRTALGLGTAATQPSSAFEAAGSVATASTADRARANHTGTQSADTLTDGTTNVAYLATERTKLAGVATAATANSPDATLLARANHTGTQAATTVTGLATVATTGVYTDLTGRPAVGQTATTKTAAYTAAAGDYVLANAATAAFSVTLPAASSAARVSVKKIDSTANAVTISPPSGTIDGATTLVITAQYVSRDLVSDGTNWWIA